MSQAKKKVAVVCPTFRQEGRDNTARYMGAMSLVDQMLNQTTEHDIYVAVVDDSKEPHKFLQTIATAHPEKFIYLHVPSRNDISSEIKAEFSEAVHAIPTDNDLKNNPFWQKRIRQMEAWAKIVPFEDSFAEKINIGEHVFNDRPTIGTKRNAGILAICERFGEPDFLIAADDDDYRSPTYVAEITDALDKSDFTRIGKYLTYLNFGDGQELWGAYDYRLDQDANGHFYPSDEMLAEPMYTSLRNEDGTMQTMPARQWWSRLSMAAWDPICNEGATHNWRYETWKQGYDEFGGYAPTNMGDEIILFRELTETFGKSVTRSIVPFEAHNFVRVADGSNASYIIYNRIGVEADVQSWATQYTDDLKDAHRHGSRPEMHGEAIATHMLKTGDYDPSTLMQKAADRRTTAHVAHMHGPRRR